MTEKENIRWEEYAEYIDKNKLTPYERRLLRSWVRDGHSVNETVESRYLPGPAYPPMDFITAYRRDRELREDMKGMPRAEKKAYLSKAIGNQKHLNGYDTREQKLRRATEHIHNLEHEMFCIYDYLDQLGDQWMLDEIDEYVRTHRDNVRLPIEWS